ncbi:MAG: trimethylamine methyltransferase family protein, partial [Deltaproteobacteria bacterium]|nr:trimethylamine methyltransferase family protein [Deltaproteobacteria bacterium]
THDHTLENFKRMSRTTLMNRDNRENWEAAGSPDIVELAYEKSIDIINNYKPEPCSEEVQRELDRIYAEFEAAVSERKARA